MISHDLPLGGGVLPSASLSAVRVPPHCGAVRVSRRMSCVCPASLSAARRRSPPLAAARRRLRVCVICRRSLPEPSEL